MVTFAEENFSVASVFSADGPLKALLSYQKVIISASRNFNDCYGW